MYEEIKALAKKKELADDNVKKSKKQMETKAVKNA
jgi:hypothetical protein